MTIAEATERVRANENATMRGEDLRALVRDLYGKATDRHGKATDREVARFLEDIRYQVIARQSGGGAIQLEPAFVSRLRREYTGPIRMDGVPLGEADSVVTIEENGSRWFIAAPGAVMSINHWLIERMAAPENTPEPAR